MHYEDEFVEAFQVYLSLHSNANSIAHNQQSFATASGFPTQSMLVGCIFQIFALYAYLVFFLRRSSTEMGSTVSTKTGDPKKETEEVNSSAILYATSTSWGDPRAVCIQQGTTSDAGHSGEGEREKSIQVC